MVALQNWAGFGPALSRFAHLRKSAGGTEVPERPNSTSPLAKCLYPNKTSAREKAELLGLQGEVNVQGEEPMLRVLGLGFRAGSKV